MSRQACSAFMASAIALLFLTSLATPTYGATVTPLLHYKMEGAPGSNVTTVVDEANGRNGTAVGDPTYVADDPGAGLTSIDFLNDRVSFGAIPELAALSGDLTVESIFKVRSLPASQQFIVANWPFGNGFQFVCGVFIDGRAFCSFSDGVSGHNDDVFSMEALEIDVWYHLAGVRDTGTATVRLYLFECLQETDVLQFGLSANNSSFSIGARHSGELPFDGLIAEIRITDAVVEPADFLIAGDCQPQSPAGITTYPHGATKQRYISFAPDASHTAMGYLIRDIASGNEWYTCTPATSPASVVGQGLTFLGSNSTPQLFDWSSLPAVHVGGCMIAPGTDSGPAGVGREYRVRATANGVTFSSELVLFTAARPTAANSRLWADIVGLFAAGGGGATTPPTPPNSWTPPNRVVAGFDISAALQGAAAAATRPHFTWGDINPEVTDRVTNGPDTLRVVNAFGVGTGKEFYPFAYSQLPCAIHHPSTPPAPALCPTPPPCP